MSVINTIKDEINSTGYSVDWIIQHSYNPRANDAIQFLVYSDNQISHIVSTYRNPVDSWKRLHDQNDLMQSVLKKVQDTPLKENVLFSTWLLDLPQGCFRIQEFRKKEFYLQVSKLNLTDLHRYLDISCAWIIDFQKVTRCGTKPVHQLAIRETIKHHISHLKSLYSQEPAILDLFLLLECKKEVINTPMVVSMHHGDYCHWNCFVDASGVYRVIDWEFAKISEWVVIDFIANLLVLWLDLRKNGLMRGGLETFLDPRDSKDAILAFNIARLTSLYGFDISEIKFYFVYVFIRLFFRKERPTSRMNWEPYLPDMMSILKSINVPRVNENS